MKRYALIVAGGHGLRIGGEVPKQFLLLNKKPVLFHTLEKFHGIADETILVLPPDYISFWEALCKQFDYFPTVNVIEGGTDRMSSVINGLLSIKGEGIVAIHDAVRPLISKSLILKLFNETGRTGNAVPIIDIRESMRYRETNTNHSVNRELYVAVQTPQCFDIQSIIKAYQNVKDKIFTDDASVFENSGNSIHLVEGETSNIKITFPEDLLIAEAILNSQKM